MMNNLSKVLQGRRKTKGLTLLQVSISSGVSLPYLARIERGERFPSARILRKLANPLDFSEVELFKLAGFLSRDDSDERADRIKQEMKKGLTQAIAALALLSAKIDSL
ncbi:hypothetical protein ES703_106639 [subsurface metagenome]